MISVIFIIIKGKYNIHTSQKGRKRTKMGSLIMDGVHTEKDGERPKSSPHSSKVPLTKS